MSDFHEEHETDREGLLLHRAIEKVATQDEWREIETAAAGDPDLWRRLCDQLRDESLLGAQGRELVAEVASADRVELPAGRFGSVRRPARILRSAFTGWLVAAAIFALWIGSLAGPGRSKSITSDAPGATAITSPSPAFRASLAPDDSSLLRVSADGNVSASDMPRILVDAKRAGDGYDLLYLRRSFERVRVPLLYDTARDENGNAAAVPVSFTDPSAWEEF